MKTKIIVIALLIAAAIILVSLNVFQSSQGPHGGTVKKAENYNIEMKNPGGSMYAYLLDRNLKPVNNKGISCKVKLFFPDKTAADQILSPFGTDGFIIELIPMYYVSCTVTFNVAGKNIEADFENEVLFVDKK